MPFNKLKSYPELLEIEFLSERDRLISLRGIFDRDISDNDNFYYRNKRIYPLKSDGEIDMDREFRHLITEEIEVEENGIKKKERYFDIFRSQRLHWIKPHIENKVTDSRILIFSVIERDIKARRNIIRTYIFNTTRKYVIVLEPQRKEAEAYFLLTAYYLNRPYGEKALMKRYKKRLPDIY